MKRVWFENIYKTKGKLVEEVGEVLGEQSFDVELFGVRRDADHLPENYEIVDDGSRDLLAVCVDGKVITDQCELDAYQFRQEFVGETYNDPDGEWEITDVIYHPIEATGQIYEACIKLVEDDVKGNPNAGNLSGVDIREAIYFLNNRNFMYYDEELYKQIYRDPRFGVPEEDEEEE